MEWYALNNPFEQINHLLAIMAQARFTSTLSAFELQQHIKRPILILNSQEGSAKKYRDGTKKINLI